MIPLSLAPALLDEARRLGVYAIVRLHRKRALGVTVQNGKVESVGSSELGGVGFQVFTDSGHTAFGFTDGFDETEATAALRRTAASAGAVASLRSVPDRAIFSASPLVLHLPDPRAERFDAVSLERLSASASASHAQTRALSAQTRVSTSATVNREDWRIERSDGTAVSWSVPRFVLHHAVTAGEGGGVATVRAHLFSPDYDALATPEAARLLSERARGAVHKALGLRAAGRYPAGVYPLLIDYALAKGLAHEAFGHAAEADSFRSSTLATGGRFRIAASGWGASRSGSSTSRSSATTPTSRSARTVSGASASRSSGAGVLHEGLADLFSAGPGGVPSKGAERARVLPQSRRSRA